MIFNPQLSASPLNPLPGVTTGMKWPDTSAEAPLSHQVLQTGTHGKQSKQGIGVTASPGGAFPSADTCVGGLRKPDQQVSL